MTDRDIAVKVDRCLAKPKKKSISYLVSLDATIKQVGRTTLRRKAKSIKITVDSNISINDIDNFVDSLLHETLERLESGLF